MDRDMQISIDFNGVARCDDTNEAFAVADALRQMEANRFCPESVDVYPYQDDLTSTELRAASDVIVSDLSRLSDANICWSYD